uniref:Uncharacterized protein n=1 Tax=Xenopus tropicalis TaxID=8364 RepID=A0A1B8XTR6_XENTR
MLGFSVWGINDHPHTDCSPSLTVKWIEPQTPEGKCPRQSHRYNKQTCLGAPSLGEPGGPLPLGNLGGLYPWGTWGGPYPWGTWGGPYPWGTWGGPYPWGTWGGLFPWGTWGGPYPWGTWGGPYPWGTWGGPYPWGTWGGPFPWGTWGALALPGVTTSSSLGHDGLGFTVTKSSDWGSMGPLPVSPESMQ